jgi:hypothetical protein
MNELVEKADFFPGLALENGLKLKRIPPSSRTSGTKPWTDVLDRLPFLVATGRLKACVQFFISFLAAAGKGFVLSKPLLQFSWHRFQMSDALPLLLPVDALQLLAPARSTPLSEHARQ